MHKSVLVTGATGFIGRQTVTTLNQAGWKVIQGVRSPPHLLKVGEIYLDLNDHASLIALENSVRFDAIVHLGAHVGLSSGCKTKMFMSNALATGYLAFLAYQWNAFLVYASTAIVCGVKSESISESTPVFADTVYAQTKLLGEKLIEALSISHCILRIGGVFGLEGPKHLGLNRAIQAVSKGNPPNQSGLGDALRNYIYVKDVAETIDFVLKHQLRGTHFLAGSEVISINQMLQIICDILLPGQRPHIIEGSDTISQVIESSKYLPKSRSFLEAINDLKGIGL